jgi:hypothetical protein
LLAIFFTSQQMVVKPFLGNLRQQPVSIVRRDAMCSILGVAVDLEMLLLQNTESAMPIDRKKDIKYLQVQREDDG